MLLSTNRAVIAKCIHCKVTAHERCSHLVPPNCGTRDIGMKDIADALVQSHVPMTTTGAFGMPLSTLVPNENGDIPYIITDCIKAIEERGLTEEGIYRIPGRAADIEALKMHFSCGRVNLSEEHWPDINAIAGALKLFFRELPEPIVPFDAYIGIVQTFAECRDPREQCSRLRVIVSALPSVNYRVLKITCRHLLW